MSGRKFHDLDADGTNDGGSDPGLSGWRIDAYTDSDRDGVLDVSEFVAGAAASAVTDANGDYTLMLAPGRYIVCEALQAGWTQSHPVVAIVCAAGAGLGASGYGVTVAHGTTDAGNDFGNF